jgi:hypothetical protein
MITEKEINSLNQLNRIEYRQKKELIDKEYKLITSEFVWFFISALEFFLIICIFINTYFDKEIALNIFKSYGKLLLIIGGAFLLICFFSDIYTIISKKNKVEELNNEFFEVKNKEVKNGKGKRS